MVSRKPFYLLVALLYIVGLGMTFYHHIALDVPLTPGAGKLPTARRTPS